MSRASLDRADYREALARHAGGVAVVAGSSAAGFRGLTASSFAAVSLEPPLVAVALDRLAATRDTILETGLMTVSVLDAGQEFLADRFAGRAPAVDPSWRAVPHRLSRSGLPIVEGAIAWFECRVESVLEAGDHDLILAAVEAAGAAGGEPLVLWDRSFWRLAR